MIALQTVERLSRIAGMFGSDHDGERAVAARKFDALLKAEGVEFSDLLKVAKPKAIATSPRSNAPEPLRAYQIKALTVLAFPELLTDWERGFTSDVAKLDKLSPRQWEQLNRIAAKVERGRQ